MTNEYREQLKQQVNVHARARASRLEAWEREERTLDMKAGAEAAEYLGEPNVFGPMQIQMMREANDALAQIASQL